MIRLPRRSDIDWLGPEDLVRAGLSRSRVLMVNEARNGLKRCVRTRRVGARILPVAWELGARVMAVEALGPPGRPLAGGPLEQPEMVDLLAAARALGFELAGYDHDPETVPVRLRVATKKPEFANWRDGRQAANLASLLAGLPPDAGMLVWCGNVHHSKMRILQFRPMGWQFKQLTRLDPFVLDQTVTVRYGSPQRSGQLLEWARPELEARGGHAGFLRGEGAPELGLGSDAWLLSLENDLE